MTKKEILLRELEILRELRGLNDEEENIVTGDMVEVEPTLEWGETSKEEMPWHEAKKWCEKAKKSACKKSSLAIHFV